MRIRSIEEAQAYLLAYSPEKMTGQTYTLERMRTLMRRLGDPQDSFRTVHVAGTSGKTSTAYFIRGLLQKSGQKTGLTASPHITSITERVQVDGKPLKDEDFLTYLDEFLGELAQWPDIKPTYFELLVALAYFVFAKEKVAYAVIEVGLGGLLDATNVITRSDKVAVITPIGLDHTEVLGPTVEAIATQKAGIILPGSDVFAAGQDSVAQKVLDTTAATQGASVHPLKDMNADVTWLPPFQQRNFVLANRVVQYIAERDNFHVAEQLNRNTVMKMTPPGRFEQYKVRGKRVLLDGAHNPQKLAALLEARTGLSVGETTWVFGVVDSPEGKIHACLDAVRSQNGRFIMTEFSSEQDMKSRRSVAASRLAAYMTARGRIAVAEPDPERALQAALAQPGTEVVVTGSLYLVARLRPLLERLQATDQLVR